MKKILYSALIIVAGLFAASCEQEHIEAVYDPSKVTAQTLGDISGLVLDGEGEALTVNFNPADFKMAVAQSYTLYASASSDMSSKVKVASTIAIENGVGTIRILQKDLNSLVYALGGAADEPFTVFFQLSASLANDKNGAIASTTIDSNIVSAEFVPYSTLIKDVDLYEHVWVIGSSASVGAWSFDNVYQYLYDYDKTGETFTGLIDFGEEGPSGGFKLTGVGNWNDDTKNWGSEAQDEAAEAGTIQLVAGGGSKDIKAYAKRYYAFSLNVNSLVLTKLYAFDNVGIVGAFNGWNAADAAMKMEYNAHLHRFYIDYTFDEASELKFTCDDSWDLNWGGSEGDAVSGGANIAVEPGSYRIYLDLNKASYEFSSSMFGKEEPTGDENDTPDNPSDSYKGWGIIGAFNDWSADEPMTENGGVWTGYFTNTAGGEFKLRKDADWAENYGGTLGSLGVAFDAVADGSNLTTPESGFYKVVLDLSGAAPKITVSAGTVWSLIGAFNNWSGDVDMTETDGKWVSPATKLSGEFKIRYNHAWDDDRGGTLVSIGTAFDVVKGGANINVPDGEYIVTYDPSAETILVEGALPSNAWSLIGVNGNWDSDIFMTELSSGIWVSPVVEFSGEFKIRYNHAWAVNRGGTFEKSGARIAVTNDGANINVPSGKYQVVYNPFLEAVTVNDVNKGWSLIGEFEGHSWDYDLFLSKVADNRYESEAFKATGGFKVRYDAAWDDDRGGTFAEDGTAFSAVKGGSNITVGDNLSGNLFKLVYDSSAETLTVTRCWVVIGQVNGSNWDKDIVMTETSTGVWEAIVTVNGEFKIRKSGTWDINRGGTLGSLGTAFSVTNGGDNIKVPANDKAYRVVYNAGNETITVTEN